MFSEYIMFCLAVESDDNIQIYRPQTVPAESTFKPFSQYQTQSRPVLVS